MLSRGTVVGISDSSIVVLEFDFLEEQDVEYTYDIDEETEYHNVASLEDLEEGDFVEMVFNEEDETRTASRITLSQ